MNTRTLREAARFLLTLIQDELITSQLRRDALEHADELRQLADRLERPPASHCANCGAPAPAPRAA